MNDEKRKEKIDLKEITLQMLEQEAFDCDGSEPEQKKIKEKIDIAWKVYNDGQKFNSSAYDLGDDLGYLIGDKIGETFMDDIKDYIIYLSTQLVIHKVVYNTINIAEKEITYD